ncbi:hypothetical protein CHS0354_004469 [Potamilus streckersoni]|uniref:Regulator of G-protein signaling 12 n=1 Tax=Potamilus streckersoni TaxID=2493646 RepID=A0AAE0SNY2_9BIVA|nr:hypothetical protein CHS0354_004469 [Potamilus streckersoni]
MYHQPPHPHHAKRRKKRPIHGLKTAEVTRGKSGYGFTISGQHPCILSCIVAGSPADCVGLKPGDYLVSVNGLDVSKAGHDEVVRMVGTSTGTLTLQVAENYNSSDSSDDEYNHRTKSSKYPNRVRVRSAARLRFDDKMDKIVAGLNQRDRHCPDGHSHDPTLRPLPQPETMYKHGHSRPRLHMPVGAENSEIAAASVPRHQHFSSSDNFKVPFHKSYSVPNVEEEPSKPTIHRVEPKQAFIKSTFQSHRRSRQASHHEPSSHDHVYNNFSPASLQQIINHSLHSYSDANEAFILQTEDSDALSDSTEDEELNLLPQNSNIKVIVGYIGSIEMPSDANVPHVRIQSIRNAVRRLRVEQKINTLVLMHVHQEGIALSNATGSTVAEYPVDRIAFSGVCPDDKRFFGIVTLHSNDEPDGAASNENFVRSSSCHVFMVDPEMNAHNIHAQKAKSFGIRCTVDPHSQRCLEFPRSTTPIIMSISNLYQDRLEGALETDVARSQVFANPNRPAERSNSNSSNSDSGLGLGREDNGHDRVVGPDLQLEQPLAPVGQIRWSGNTIHLTHGPIRHLSPDTHTVATLHHPLSALSTDANRSFLTSTNSDDCFKAGEKLNVRAVSESVQNSLASPKDNLEKDYSAERLRQSMQKLLQARQKHIHEKQFTSDQDSQNLKENNSAKKKQQCRPISAPFKCLSGEYNVDNQQKVDSSKVESVEMNLADKLSPRAFLSSAFTPVGSASSAFRKVKSSSSSLMNQIRSPSAPPIPNYHGDDEDSDDDVNLIIEHFERDRALGLTVEAEPRRHSGGLSMAKKRDSDKKNSVVNTEKWTKGGGSVRQKPRQRTSLSHSHESLVVIDTDPVNHRLSAANSVNSIINNVREEKEEVGRVAGWAVNFDKMLRDFHGLHVFTEFLKKEFSEENIVFWTAVEKYKQITDQDMRKVQAKDIFNKHLSVRASEPVNIDSIARQQADSQMDIPTPQIFDMAQHQIYQLMKQDSYARFLKSELYKTCLLKEMEGKPLDIPQEENKKGKESDEKEKDSKKKSKGKENEDKEKRRRSLLPWRQKTSKSGVKTSSDAETKKSKAKENEKEKDKRAELNNKKSTSATTALPTVTPDSVPSVSGSLITTKKEVQANRNEEPIPDAEQPKFCRVILPDGSTTVVCAKAGQTINNVLGKLCEKRSISIASVDIFLLGSDKPLNLSEDISVLCSKEVIIEKRVLFRMDLPNKKSIGVKAKPNRVILDVFRPILHKYGFKIDSIEVYLSGHKAVVDLDGLVSSLDNQRVAVVSKDDCQGYQRRRSSFFGFIEKRVHRHGSKATWEDKDETKGDICTPEERGQKTPKR